jgi:C4-dicarboxylate transporter DctM subunit
LGVLIPPSIPIMTYGVATSASIATLFMGGMDIGIICGLFLMAFAYVTCRRLGFEGNGLKFSFKRSFTMFKSAIGALLVPLIILGGIYSGLFTPTEAAVVAVFYAALVGFFWYKELTIKKLVEALTDSAVSNSTLMVIVATAIALSRAIAYEQIPAKLSAAITAFTDSPIVVLVLINIVLLITCCIMEVTPAILLLAPLLLPIAVSYGVDPIHFGLMMVFNCTIGFVTPPVGLNLYVAAKIGEGIEFGTLIKNVVPFLIIMLILLVIITYIPDVSLFLPRVLLGYGQ